MLDWSKIDTWQKFQRLVNALFELEMNSTDFMPSDPDVGADGGQDGKIRNNGDYLDKSGTFLIQAKYQKEGAKPSEAFNKIKTELVEKEFINYKKHKADCLFLCVNVPLNTKIDYRNKLEELAQNNQVNIIICDRPWLEPKIEKHPYLVKWWFEGVPNLSIEPPKVYFEKYEKELISDNTLYCGTRYNDLSDKFTEFLKSEDKFIGIFAPGGEGKTHFIRNIFMKNKRTLDRECYILKDLGKNVSEVFENEINQEHQYLLVVDDLDKWLQSDLRTLLKHIHHSQTVKLIFTSRVVNESMFRELLGSIGIISPRLYCFPAWQENELLEILYKFSGKIKIEDDLAIVAKFNKPFYLKLIADALNRSEYVTPKNIVPLIMNREKNLFKSIISSYLPNKSFSDLDVFLFELSLILPSFQNEELLGVIMRYFNLSKESSEKVINDLIKDGFLRKIGRSYRFSPDMKGDIFIVNAFDSLDENVIGNIVASWFEQYPDNVVKNLYYSVAFEDKARKKITKFLKDLAHRIVSDFNLLNPDKLSGILSKVEYLALIVPEVGEKLIEGALSFLEAGKLSKKTWNSDKFASLLKSLMLHKKCDNKVIHFLFKMHDLQIDGYYDNQKIASLLRHFVSPAYFRIEVVHSRLDEILNIKVNTGTRQSKLQKSVEVNDPGNIQLFKAIFQELLSGAYEHTKSLSYSMVLGAIPFNDSKEGIEIRDKCIRFIIEKWLYSGDYLLMNFALDVIDNFGRVYLGGVTLDPDRYKRLDQERKTFFDALDSEKFGLKDFEITSRIEKMLLRWWSSNQFTFQNKIENFLISKIPDNLEFYLYKYFERGLLCILKSFASYYKECPKDTDKWHWLIDHVETNTYKWKEENYLEFATRLQKEYHTSDSKIELFERLQNMVDLPVDKMWDIWVSIAIDDFYQIFKNKEKWERLPDSIRKITFSRLAEKYSDVKEEYKKYFYNKLPSPDTDEMHLFLSFIKEDDKERKKLFDIFADQATHKLVSSLIFEIRREKAQVKSNFLRKYLTRVENFDDRQTEDNIDMMLQMFIENNEEIVNDNIRKLLIQKLLKTCVWRDHVVDIIRIAKFSKNQLWELLENRKLNDYSSEEKTPYLFVSSLNKVFDQESYEFIFNNLIDLEYHIWPNSFSELVNMRNNTGGLFVELFFDKITDIKMLSKILRNLDFTDVTFPLWEKGLKLLIEEVKFGNFHTKELREILSYKTMPCGGYSSSPGEAPPALVHIKDLFNKMRNDISEPLINPIIGECIEYVEKSIKESIERDNEIRIGRG